MTDAPASGNKQQPFPATNLAPYFIDQINGVSIGPNIRLTLGNLTGIGDEATWRTVIVIPDQLAAGLLALLTELLMRKGVIQGEAVKDEGGSGDAQDRQRFN